jgi:DNA-binding CsgD family transcriptional regulator
MMSEFSEAQGLFDCMKPEDKEKLLDLRDELHTELWRLVDNELTERQREVIHLYAQNYTQIEIAKILGVNQSSITKSINGNCDYRGTFRKSYGGSSRKLRRLADKDHKIQEIRAQIAEIHEEYT